MTIQRVLQPMGIMELMKSWDNGIYVLVTGDNVATTFTANSDNVLFSYTPANGKTYYFIDTHIGAGRSTGSAMNALNVKVRANGIIQISLKTNESSAAAIYAYNISSLATFAMLGNGVLTVDVTAYIGTVTTPPNINYHLHGIVA
ncbi:MAG: hypothetical protein KGI08_07295 [Thaumarchaeota archaeon]|nr:hypothetical protein [Nitrososphaerota archaeon]